MLQDFKAFIAKGNVLDLAVAVIIGAAFAKIVTSLTDDIIMPVVGKIFGGLDFSSHFLLLGPVPADYHGSMTDYGALKKAGVAADVKLYPGIGHIGVLTAFAKPFRGKAPVLEDVAAFAARVTGR